MAPDYYDRQGRPISEWEWCALKKDARNTVVGRSRVVDEHAPHLDVEVWTSWCGWNRRLEEDATPAMFETIFQTGASGEIPRLLRLSSLVYPSEAVAVQGHRIAVRVASAFMSRPLVTTSHEPALLNEYPPGDLAEKEKP